MTINCVSQQPYFRKTISHHFTGQVFRRVIDYDDLVRLIWRVLVNRGQTISENLARIVRRDDHRKLDGRPGLAVADRLASDLESSASASFRASCHRTASECSLSPTGLCR